MGELTPVAVQPDGRGFRYKVTLPGQPEPVVSDRRYTTAGAARLAGQRARWRAMGLIGSRRISLPPSRSPYAQGKGSPPLRRPEL